MGFVRVHLLRAILTQVSFSSPVSGGWRQHLVDIRGVGHEEDGAWSMSNEPFYSDQDSFILCKQRYSKVFHAALLHGTKSPDCNVPSVVLLSLVSRMGENPCSLYLNSGTLQDYAQFFASVFGFCWVLSPSTSTLRFPHKSASSGFTDTPLPSSGDNLRSAKMSTTSNGLFQREGKVVVAALVLVLLAMTCGPVGGSRFTKSPASARRAMVRFQQPPPPTDDVPLAPPPPDSVTQFPPPVHHRVYPPPSSPPSWLHPPSHAPPSRFHRSPPPLSSPPPPLPPPVQDREQVAIGKHSQQNGRRLFSSEDVADPNSSSDQELSGREKFSTVADASPGKCANAPSVDTPLIPYGGGYVPVGAPFPSGDPGVLTPEPAPSPTAGVDGPSNNQSALPPLSGDNGTLAHTTMVSAMKLNQCTYTIITCTGNIEGAGTQADVNVEFFDKHGESVLFVNLKSQSRNFNRGATDTFTVVGDCVQNICRMHLSHDDSGPNPSWFVTTVTVSLMYQTHVFNVFEWLAKDEPPYSLSRTVSSCPA